jgi:hypothetical protein
MTRECDVDYDWKTNAGNGDALCHDETTGQGRSGERNTIICERCPYNMSMIVE